MILKIAIVFILVYLIACSPSKKMMKTSLINPDASDSLEGLKLVKESDCVTCHSIKEKLIGPSFTNIAVKYDLTIDNINKLSEKIIRGGGGVWHEIPMTPHPDVIKENAKAMVKYILLLKK